MQFTTRGRTESNNRIRLKQFFAKRPLVSIRGNCSSKNSSDNRFAYIFFSISLPSFFPSPLFFQNREQSFKQKKRITVPATVHFSASNNIRYIRAVYIDDSDVGGGGVKKLQWRENKNKKKNLRTMHFRFLSSRKKKESRRISFSLIMNST